MRATDKFLSAKTTPSLQPAPPKRSADGVDLTLIRWMLSLSPTERLEALQQAVWSLHELHHGRSS